MAAASWGPRCSVGPTIRCNSRRLAERDGDAYYSLWHGLLYPLNEESIKGLPYAWDFCPWCGGDVRLGIRQQIQPIEPPSWQADGEGDA